LTVTFTGLGSDLQTETGSVVARSRIDECPLVDVRSAYISKCVLRDVVFLKVSY
jgi:hypothetical protein